MAFEARILDTHDTDLLEEFYIHYSSQTKLNLNLKLDLSPDFWDALSVLGHDTQILAVIEKKKKHIACACAISLKKCYLGGNLYTIGYMSSMKARKEYMGTLAFAIFMKLFNAYWQETKATCWLFSVFSANEVLNKLMHSPHHLFPKVEIISGYTTYLFKPGVLKFNYNSNIQVRYAEMSDLGSIETFLKKESKRNEFFPEYSKDEISNGKGLLKDFSMNNLALAFREKKIIGMAGLWDQASFRRWFVESYSAKYRAFLPLLNLGARIKKMPLYPPEGEPINYKLLSLMLAESNNIEIFEPLFRKITEIASNNDILSVGFADQHPANRLFRKKCVRMQNNLYLAYKKESAELIRNIHKDQIYIEQGGL